MFGFSLGEVLFIGGMALIVIGPKQLPEVARSLGRLLNELRRATEGFGTDLKNQTRVDFDLKPTPRPSPPPKPPAPVVEDKQLDLFAAAPENKHDDEGSHS